MRIPKPDDLRPVTIEPARSIAQINENVAGRIGQAGRSMGNAIEAIGAAFGDVANRQAEASDATNLARAKLDWYKFDNEAWTGIQNRVGEDGTGWEQTASVYDKGRADILSRYPIANTQRRQELEFFLERQVAERGFAAAGQKQKAAGGFYRGIEDKEIEGAVARIEANPSQETVDSMRGPLNELVEGGRGIYHSEATIQARKRQIEGALLMGQYRGLIKTDPEAAQELFNKIQGGQYEIEQPRPQGGVRGDLTFPVLGGDINSVPRDGGSKNSREHMGPRGGGSHAGWDIPLKVGQPVVAASDGVVISKGSGRGYGEYVDVQMADGTIHRMAHLGNQSKGGGQGAFANGIEVGARVKRGQEVGYGGHSGNAGPEFSHVHYEIFPDKSAYDKAKGGSSRATASLRINPREYFAASSSENSTASAPSSAGGIAPKLTAYSPQRGGSSMEGGYASSQAGPDQNPKDAKTWKVNTLEDFQAGRAKYITIAGDPSQYGKSYTIPRIEWIDSNGKKQVSENVKAVVHNTGSAFKGKGESRFDIPVAKDLTDAQMNAQPFLKGGVQFVADGGPEKARPVGERSLTRYAGLSTGAKSDAVAGEASPAGDDIHGLIADLKGISKDAPDLPLTEAIDKETLIGLADQYPQIASIPDFDNVTVGDAVKAIESGQGGQRTLPPKAEILSPMGRLVPGQNFSVKTKHGEISVSADAINALDKSTLRKFQAEAREMATIRQREGEAIAEDLVRKQLLTVETTGGDHKEWNAGLLQEVYRKNPKKLAEVDRRIGIAKMVHEATADAVNLPNDILEDRLDTLRGSIVDQGGDADPDAQSAFDRAEKKMKALMSARERDPARAVRDAREVQAVREAIPGGEARNKAHLYQLADATIKAQIRLGLPEVPVSKAEARTIMADIIYAPESKKREVAKEVAKKVHDTYGSLAEKVMASAIKLTSGDSRDDDDMLSSSLKRIQRDSIKSVDQVTAPPKSGGGWFGGIFGGGGAASKREDRIAPQNNNYFDQYDGAN